MLAIGKKVCDDYDVMTTTEHPLVKALYGFEGKAEIVHGTIAPLPMTGYDPHYAALEVAFSLRLYVRRTGTGNDGAPDFAVVVRSEHDDGPAAARELAAKRADYFAAGTLVVRDVDLLGEDVVRVYRNNDLETPAAVCRRGQTAAAEPAVPGWTMPVNDLFRP